MPFKKFTLHTNHAVFKDNFIKQTKHWTHETKAIQLFECTFELKHYESRLFSEFGVFFPNEMKRALNKRQAEFLAGRFAAKLCCLEFGFQQKNLPNIGIKEDRSPIWPLGFMGSITHCSNKALCAIVELNHSEGIGIDIEEVICMETAKEIGHLIHCTEELELLLATGMHLNLAATLIFCAKECVFKATYHKVQAFFGFECAKVTSIDLEKMELVLEMDHKFSLIHRIKDKYAVHFAINGNEVVCGIF